jgi:alkylhydroperoxidase/carboxymuconolactone decarboxylase family protein YurZ
MPMDALEDYNAYRQKMNKKLLGTNDKVIKKIFNTDANAYKEGALFVKTKEILGLVTSMVLRCGDCIKYHLIKCFENRFAREELFAVFGIVNLVEGIIVIHHTRRTLEL